MIWWFIGGAVLGAVGTSWYRLRYCRPYIMSDRESREAWQREWGDRPKAQLPYVGYDPDYEMDAAQRQAQGRPPHPYYRPWMD